MNVGAAVSIHHGLDELQLLPILLAKNSHLRSRQFEQAPHHSGHPSKMPWAVGVFKAGELHPTRVFVQPVSG